MKAVLTNKIFLEASADLMDNLSSKLTYSIPSSLRGQPPTVIKTFGRVNANICTIPSGRQDLIPPGYEIIDKRIFSPVVFPPFTATLRESQQVIYDAIEESCIINAQPSWGKTFTGIAIATKLKQKTLVVTHTTMLRDQWVEEVEKVLGFTPGIIGSSKFNTDSPIVIANTQTLVKHMDKLTEMFGLIILDEAHHVPATTFSTIIDKCKARYKIGLTGTLERKDGKHVVFRDYFGDIVYKPEKENFMQPSVVIVETDVIFPGGKFWANRITELEVYNKEYQQIVADMTDAAVGKGHKVLVVAGRVELLKACSELSKCRSATITGELKSLEERNKLLKGIEEDTIDAIYGTLSIFAEGISQSALSCIILATPINNDPLMHQVTARVCRERPGKKQPLIIDINLIGNSVRIQQRNRMAYYIRQGYTIRKLKK